MRRTLGKAPPALFIQIERLNWDGSLQTRIIGCPFVFNPIWCLCMASQILNIRAVPVLVSLKYILHGAQLMPFVGLQTKNWLNN